MPTYEYECKVCGNRFERKQSVTEDSVRICPECGGQVRKIFFPAGIIFKGSGFYKTDNAKSSSSSSESKSESGSNGSGNGSKDGKSEPAKTEAAKSDPPPTESLKHDAGKSSSNGSTSAKSDSK